MAMKKIFTTIVVLLLAMFIGGIILAVPGVSESHKALAFSIYLVFMGVVGLLRMIKIL
jgi:hypothetical protein